MFMVVILSSLFLPINLVSEDIVIDLFYLSELKVMNIYPPSNKTHICKSRYPLVGEGQYIVSLYFNNRDRKGLEKGYVFVTRSNEQVIKSLKQHIKMLREFYAKNENAERSETFYSIKDGYVFWSENQYALKYFTEYKSKTDYGKYEELMTDLYDEIRSHDYDEVKILRNQLPIIDREGKALYSDGFNDSAIVCQINSSEGDSELFDNISIFMNKEDAKSYYDRESKSIKKEISELNKERPHFITKIEFFDLSGNIVKYRFVRVRK